MRGILAFAGDGDLVGNSMGRLVPVMGDGVGGNEGTTFEGAEESVGSGAPRLASMD